MAKRKLAEAKNLSPSDPNSENSPKRAQLPTVVVNNPLSYESLKIVLQHMDPNKRFEVATVMPSIRPTNRIVPLKIDSLSFGEMSMTVNNTKYQLGIIREQHDRRREIKGIEEDNLRGGILCDLDPYGLYDETANAVVTPGDICFQDQMKPKKCSIKDYQRRLNSLRRDLENDSIGSNPSELQMEIFLLEHRLKKEVVWYDNFDMAQDSVES